MAERNRTAPVPAPATGTITGEWECDECGYTRRGSLRNRPRACPECSAPGDAFSFWSDDGEDDVGDWDDEDEDWDDEDWDEDEEDEEEY